MDPLKLTHWYAADGTGELSGFMPDWCFASAGSAMFGLAETEVPLLKPD